MSQARLDEMTVAEVMDRWPACVRVFERRHMACPGCVMAPFMTVAEAAHAYALPPVDLVDDLHTAIAAGAATEEATW